MREQQERDREAYRKLLKRINEFADEFGESIESLYTNRK